MTTLPDAAIGPITAAVIAALLSLIGLIVAKEHKTSEFRQAWIDAVRDDIATLMAAIYAIHAAESLEAEASKDLWKNVRVDYVAANQALFRLKLRLNPREPVPSRLRDLFKQVEDLINADLGVDANRLDALETDIMDAASVMLKTEWRRVKSGEWTFRIIKWTMIVAVLLSVVLSAVALW